MDMEFSTSCVESAEEHSEDAAHLGEMLCFFRQECLDYLEGNLEFVGGTYNTAVGRERRLDDGRWCMTQFPHGHESTAKSLMSATSNDHSKDDERELSFVGFLGRRNPEMTSELTERTDKVVDSLMAELCGQPEILLYGTAQCSAVDNNHYNLVVLKNEEAGTTWKQGELHLREAINNIAPKFYTSIRIHVGVLPDGLDSKQFILKRSVLLDYTKNQKDPSAPIRREVKLWTNQ